MATQEIKVPDIGDFKDVPIIQVFVKPGDAVKPEDPLVPLPSDQGTQDAPPPARGAGPRRPAGRPRRARAADPPPPRRAPAAPPPATAPSAPPAAAPQIEGEAFKKAHASPSVRKFARELGVDLSRVTGSGPKGRILQADVQAYVKGALSA